MTVHVKVAVATVAVAVDGTATELDRWAPGEDPYTRITLENTDGAQTYNGWLETRPERGTGSWSRVGETNWEGIGPGEARDLLLGDQTMGAGEVRFMAQADGAGGTGNYTRKRVFR